MNDSMAQPRLGLAGVRLQGWKFAVNWIAAVLLAVLFLSSGIWKVTDVPGWALRLAQAKVPEALSVAGALIVGVAETIAGVLLLVPRLRRWGAILSGVMPEDLLKFGLIPEFVGRLPVIGAVHNLDHKALMEILTAPKNALLKQYQKFFMFDDVDLHFTDDALEAVAEQALARGTGARGLRAILEEVLLSVMYEVPSDPNAEKVQITRDTVLEKVYPTIVPRDFVGRRARHRGEERSA